MAHIQPDENAGTALQKIDAADFKSPSNVADTGALQLVVQDAINCEAWLQNNYWSFRWREADVLYQSPPGVLLWEGTSVPRANLNRFTVAETVNAIHPQIMNGLFYEKPAFKLRPRPNMTENTSRAISALLDIQFDSTEMNFKEECDWGLFSGLNFGTAIWKWGFKNYTKKVTKYKQVGSPVNISPSLPGEQPTQIETPESMMFEKVIEEKPCFTPTFENRDIRYVLVDSGLAVPDIRKAKFVVDRMYLTYRDLIQLKDEEYVETYKDENGKKKQRLKKRYDLPAESVIRSWFEEPKEGPAEPGRSEALNYAQGTTMVHHAEPKFKKTTEDPLNEPLEVLERWDNDKVITVIQRVKVIRNEPNEFACIPFFSVNWWNIPSAFWGLGLGRVIGVEQRVQQGLINACLDLASLIVNPMWVRARGAQIQEQMIRQRIGGILTADVGGNTGVKSVQDALKMLEQPQIPESVIGQIGMSQQRVQMTSGANEQLTMGAQSSGKAGAMRTGTGAAGLIQAVMSRLGGFVEAFVRQVYEPWLYKMHELNKDKLPMSYIQEVLGDKLGPEYKLNYSEFMTAPAEFEVLAGSHLAAKAQMAQSLFMMIEIFGNQQFLQMLGPQHKKLNVEELLHMVHDVSGFKNYYNVIEDMEPDEIQRFEASQNAPAQKIQGQMQLNDQKFKQDQQIVDQESEARVARDIFRHIAEQSAMPQALMGAEAPAAGVGSNETG